MCWWVITFFVIFAVLDVSLAVNLCINFYIYICLKFSVFLLHLLFLFIRIVCRAHLLVQENYYVLNWCNWCRMQKTAVYIHTRKRRHAVSNISKNDEQCFIQYTIMMHRRPNLSALLVELFVVFGLFLLFWAILANAYCLHNNVNSNSW